MQTINIEASSREGVGKKANKALRKEGGIPGVIYGGKENFNFSTTQKELKGLIYTPQFQKAVISFDGHSHECILKDVQWDPVTDEIVHVDFLKMVDGQKLVAEIPVGFTGVSPGVKAGGTLLQKMRKIKVKALPKDLVDKLTVDVSKLKLGHSVRVRDINPIEGIEIMSAEAAPVGSVEVPRALRGKGAAGEEEEDAA